MTRIAYIDCFAGASGDMLLGALIDAGWPLADLQAVADALGLNGVTIRAEPVVKHGLSGTQVHIDAPDAQPLRHPADLKRLIAGAALPDAVTGKALAVIDALATVEARVHGIPLEDVHFHEVGAVDTLVDVVGVIAGLHALGIARVVAAPVPWSHGLIRIAHGEFPVPPPAVAALLEGVPVRGVDVDGELVTPTGAALLTGLAESFGLLPAMTVARVAYGAGTRDWPDRPNMLRLVLGEDSGGEGLRAETLTVLACNLDDMVAEWYGPLVESAFQAGALDAWLTPVHMKKGRPAVVVEVLCRPSDAPALRELLFQQTTTLGIRETRVLRWALPRASRTVQTVYGPVRVKTGQLPGGGEKFSPEHDDCVAGAAKHGVSVREVWLAAVQAAQVGS
jgi:uncharacterized protein (TIGR00299 family) protein